MRCWNVYGAWIVALGLVLCSSANASGQVTDTLSLKRGVVKIVSGMKGQAEEVGAGIVIARHGEAVFVLTAAHVIQEGDAHPRISFYARPFEAVEAEKVVGIERRLAVSGGREIDPEGLAVLYIKGPVPPETTVLPLAKSTEYLQGGEDVKAIGFPIFQDKGWMVSTGSMSSDGGGEVLIFSADIAGGNSGGPLIHEGVVVGVVMVSMAKRQAMAVPIEKVRLLLKEWKISVGASRSVLIPQGSFIMGSAERSVGMQDSPSHSVQIQAFQLDEYETTTGEYRTFLQSTRRQSPLYWEQAVPGKDDDKPVIGLTWEDAYAYCAWAGKRLPTEAEWEKAASGGDQKIYPWGNTHPDPTLANFDQALTTTPYRNGVRPVGSFDRGKSPFGVYDMAGNAWEWVADWYDKDYYLKSPKDNPRGPAQGSMKVLRGGSWLFGDIRSSARDSAPPTKAAETFGVRCAKDAK